jgi:RNA-directed DNA polymerase
VSYFTVDTRAELAKLLLVAPHEIDEVLQNRGRYYRTVQLPKRDGGTRILRVPGGRLKLLQDKVRRHVLDRIASLDCVHGGVRGRSVVTNAGCHVGKEAVFTLDVKDFFPSVGPATASAIFRVLGFDPEALATLVEVTTWDDQLPQGAPTSVGMANLAMYRVDVRVSRLALKQGFAYTRYVDDLAVSGSWRLLDFRRLIQRIVEEEGFTVNPAKMKTMSAGTRQVVTGIVVNKKLNLPRDERDSIRRQVREVVSSDVRSSIVINRVRGRISWLSSVNATKASRLRLRMARAGFHNQTRSMNEAKPSMPSMGAWANSEFVRP